MDRIKKATLLLILLPLAACGPPTPPQPPQQPSAVPSTAPTQSPPKALDHTAFKELRASKLLELNTGDELLLIGEAILKDNKSLSFDDIHKFLHIENSRPEIVSLDLASRIIKAQKAGESQIKLSIKDRNDIQALITIKVINTTAAKPETTLQLEID